jgi:hypothetical protein
MSTIDKQFISFLTYLSEKHGRGFNRLLSKKTNLSDQYVSLLVKGTKSGTEETRRLIATALGHDYGDFLEKGRAVLAGRDPDAPPTEEDPGGRGLLSVPYSNGMRLSAGSGGTIEADEDAGSSRVVLHGPSIGRHSARSLQAFRVGGDSMEPLIAEGGIVVADLSDNDPARRREGKIYVLCYDLDFGECAVKFLSWAAKDRLLAFTSQDAALYPAVHGRPPEVRIVGRVIWASREFK